MEIILRIMDLPKEKYILANSTWPPRSLIGKAFLPDNKLFWELAPGYDGPWTLNKREYTYERLQHLFVDYEKRQASYLDKGNYSRVTWQINDLGFRGEKHNPESKIILFVGSSVTMGWGVDAKDCFAGLIRKRLSKEGLQGWDVINAGVAGYSSYQIIRRLKKICKTIHPYIIIFEAGINDGVFTPGQSDEERGRLNQNTLISKCLSKSNLFLFAYYLVHNRSRQISFSNVTTPRAFYSTSLYAQGRCRVSEQSFRKNITAAEKVAKQINAKIYFIFPPLYNEYGHQRIWKSVHFYHPNEIDICDRLLLLNRAAIGNFFLPYDEAHFSKQGHGFVANIIWDVIKKELLKCHSNDPQAVFPETGTHSLRLL